MPIDTGLVIQYLALALGITGVVLSLSYPQSLANRLRLSISSNAKNAEEVTQKVDAATARMEDAIKGMEKTNKNIGRIAAEIDELNTSTNSVHKRIDGLSKSLIAAEYTMRKNSKDLASLTITVQNTGNKLTKLDKSGGELESELSKLGKVTLWTERNVKELKQKVKYVKTKSTNGRRKNNGHANHKASHKVNHRISHSGNGKQLYTIANDNGNGNDKQTEKVLVKETTV